MKSLYHYLSKVTDNRRKQGQRTPIAAFLEMIVLAAMSGHNQIRPMSRFIDQNEDYFVKRFGLLYGTPSYGTVRHFLKKLEYSELNKAVKEWGLQYINQEEWLAIDGKAIGSTVSHSNDSEQNFKSMVSIFCSKKGIVVDTESIENKKENEGNAARDLIERCELKGMTFTMDALHCQKKRRKPSWSHQMTMSSK